MKPVEIETKSGKTEAGKKVFFARISFPLFGYILKRILIFIPTLFIISLLTFILISAAPGDPAETMLSRSSSEGQASDKLATERSYRELRHKLGLDLPIFYFAFTNTAQSDTLIRIPTKNHREMLDRLVYEYGNWPQIENYYHQLKTLEFSIIATKKDSTNVDALIELRNTVAKVFIHHQDVVLSALFTDLKEQSALAPNLVDIKAKVEATEIAYSKIKSEASVWKRYVPKVQWSGTHNQYHRWLFGEARWVGEETDPTLGKGFIRGDYGISFFTKRPVKSVIWDGLWITMLISILVIVIEYIISIPLGISLAIRKGSAYDSGMTVALFITYSLPVFWIGTMAIFFLCSPDYIEIFPPFGLGDATMEDGFFYKFGDLAYHLALPLIIASYASFAYLSRQMRGSMLTVLGADYIRTARAKGLPENKVIWRHAFRNSLLPIITIFASFFPALIGGSIILEFLFTIPGLGQITYAAVIQKDYPMILTNTMFAAILTLVGYLVSDILYAVVDPRISYSKK
ncbi:MAG: ABC transporter permease [Bacteroidota bacterium]